MSEEVELQQAAVETTPEQAAQQPETAPENQTDVDTTAQAKEDEDEHSVPKGVQKRIDRLTQEKYRLRAELDFLRSQQPQQAQPAQQAAQKKTVGVVDGAGRHIGGCHRTRQDQFIAG